jgi:hypothetical protein
MYFKEFLRDFIAHGNSFCFEAEVGFPQCRGRRRRRFGMAGAGKKGFGKCE